ncbi:hypothetical protein EON83_23655 [bacterium]|nr:MAG: hypothetical protein EON83_23655 [bacterium]
MKTPPPRLVISALVAGTSLLSVFSSTAHAYWLPAEYTVTNRLKNGKPDTGPSNVPNGGGDASYINSSISATITAKFKWRSAGPDETVPETVYVLQYSSASWSAPTPEAQAANLPNANFQQAIFPSKQPKWGIQQAILSLMQAPQLLPTQTTPTPTKVSGSASNGLGDPEVAYQEGNKQGGVSKGYDLAVLHPIMVDGETFVKTEPVTLRASAVGTFGIPSLGYHS